MINAAFQQTTPDFETSKSCQREPVDTPKDQNDRRRILYKAAMIIKSDTTRQPESLFNHYKSMNCVMAKKTFPESLYWYLRLLISAQDTPADDIFETPKCPSLSDEKHIVMIGQGIIHNGSHDRIKSPKHTALAMTVRHLTGSKQLVTILNRMGHCASHDSMEVIDTALARDILVKTDIDGVVPTNITSDSFVQFSADNVVINEDTLNCKQTTHATTLVVYQRGQFGTVH